MAPMYYTLRMDTASALRRPRDLITVDLRGMKAALLMRSTARGVSPSEFVRQVLCEALERETPCTSSPVRTLGSARSERLRLTVRLDRRSAETLAERSRQAQISQSSFVAGLIAGMPVLADGGSYRAHLDVLSASNAELVLLTTSLNHLIDVLRHGSVQQALEYRKILETLVPDVRRHLALAAAVVSDLKPRHRSLRRGHEQSSR